MNTTPDPFMTYGAEMDAGTDSMRLSAATSSGTATLRAVKTAIESA